jgi:hypothetical protein
LTVLEVFTTTTIRKIITQHNTPKEKSPSNILIILKEFLVVAGSWLKLM